jgi:general stress protein 26
MQKQELKNCILDVITKYPVGSLATIKDGKPWVRYMAVQPQDDLTLFTTTFALSRKVYQIRKNGEVHLAFGADPSNWALPYVNVEGTAEILTDAESKMRCWKEEYKQYYKGPDDPNYVVIRIVPRVIEYMAVGAHQPEIYIT